MDDLQQRLLKISDAVFAGTPVMFAYLYGSHARGVPHRFSDLDIGVVVETPRQGADLDLELSLSLRIDELLNHQASSEVRVLNYLPLTVIGRILCEAKRIYSRDEDKRVQFETRFRSAYFDFLPVIRHYQETYRKKLLSEA